MSKLDRKLFITIPDRFESWQKGKEFVEQVQNAFERYYTDHFVYISTDNIDEVKFEINGETPSQELLADLRSVYDNAQAIASTPENIL